MLNDVKEAWKKNEHLSTYDEVLLEHAKKITATAAASEAGSPADGGVGGSSQSGNTRKGGGNGGGGGGGNSQAESIRKEKIKIKEMKKTQERNLYDTTHHHWIGEKRSVWQDKTCFRARSDLVNMWSQDDCVKRRRSSIFSDDSDHTYSDLDSGRESSNHNSDMEDEEEGEEHGKSGAMLLEDEECTAACGNVRELAVVNLFCGRAVPRDITNLLFEKLLSTTATNHAIAATLSMSINSLPPGIASNCWRPNSWSVVSNVLGVVADEAGRMERSTRFGNHVLALSIVVDVFEAEKRVHTGRMAGVRNRGETTLGHWLSRGEENLDTKVPMLSEMLNKAIILYTLSVTNKMLGHDSFTAMRAWSLCRRLVNVALWALLNDVTYKSAGGGSSSSCSSSSSSSSSKSNGDDIGLRMLQLKLLRELWEGLQSVSNDNTASFVPSDGRGHLFDEVNCTSIVVLLKRSREQWAHRLRTYCEK